MNLLISLLLLTAWMAETSAFLAVKRLRLPSTFVLLATSPSDDANDDSSRERNFREQNEALLEAMAASGAAKVATMSVPERTKRAMLAEAVEDRIFQLQDDLEELSGGVVPEDEKLRSQCVDVARQIKLAQKQYQDLVSGEPSEMLKTLESLGKMSSDDDDE